MTPNKKEFKAVYGELETGAELTFEMVGRVFGPSFWVLVVYAFMDANDAARAIQNAIGKLKEEGKAHE